VAPRRCYRPPALTGDGRVWGFAVQLPSLRSRRNWGSGDFRDLTTLIDFAADAGADAIGLNPLHALKAIEPERASPYSPSSRLFGNPLYLDIEAIPEFASCEPARRAVADPRFQARLQALRESTLVDFVALAGARRASPRSTSSASSSMPTLSGSSRRSSTPQRRAWHGEA